MLRIGLVDSGIGGFSILKAFLEMPQPANVEFIYVADSGHLPYGLKSNGYIHDRMLKIARFLINIEKIDALVIACNTATAVSARTLRDLFPHIPIIGTEPAVKPASLATKTGHIAVAATQSTLDSDRFNQLIKKYASNCTVHKIVGSSWVELVEAQRILPDSNVEVLQETLQAFQQYPIDQLVLGCTHFPFLMPALGEILNERVTIIDPAKSIVQECYKRLENRYDVFNHSHQEEAFSESRTLKTDQVSLSLYTTGVLSHFKAQCHLLDLTTIPHTILSLEA